MPFRLQAEYKWPCHTIRKSHLILASLILALLASQSDGYIYNWRAEGGPNMTWTRKTMDQFGFLKGGVFRLFIACDRPSADVRWTLKSEGENWNGGTRLSCITEAVYTFRDQIVVGQKNYIHNVSSFCPNASLQNINDARYNSPDFYHVNIEGHNVSCTMKITLESNEYGNQLSSDEIPIPNILKGFFITFTVLLSYYIISGILYQRYTNGLYYLLFFPIAFKTFYLLFHWRLWEERSRHGDPDFSNDKDNYDGTIVLKTFSSASLLLFLFMVSTGYCVIRLNIFRIVIPHAIFYTMLYFISFILYEYVDKNFVAAIIFSVIWIALLTLKQLGMSIAYLRDRQQAILEFAHVRNLPIRSLETGYRLDSPLIGKYYLLVRTRALFSYFAAFWCIVNMMDGLFEKRRWVRILLLELLDALLYYTLLFLYRMRDFSPYIPRLEGQNLSNSDSQQQWEQRIKEKFAVVDGLDKKVGFRCDKELMFLDMIAQDFEDDDSTIEVEESFDQEDTREDIIVDQESEV